MDGGTVPLFRRPAEALTERLREREMLMDGRTVPLFHRRNVAMIKPTTNLPAVGLRLITSDQEGLGGS